MRTETQVKRVSVTEIRTYKRCREEHRLMYADRIRPVARPAYLAFGTVMHAGLDAWWPTVSLELALKAIAAEAGREGLDPWARVRAEVLMTGYHERWAEEQAGIQTQAVEASFKTSRNDYVLFGKLDKLARKNGRPVFVEHKTTSEDISPGASYWRRLTLDDQLGVYFEGAHSLGFEAEACIYDVIRKLKIDPLKATPKAKRKYKKDGTLYANQRERDETLEEYRARLIAEVASRPDHYFRRVEQVRLDHERARARRDIDLISQDILRARPGQSEPRSPDACLRYGRMCPFFDVCLGTADIQDENRFRRAQGPRKEYRQ